MSKTRIVVNNPLAKRERVIDPSKSIRFEVGDAIFRVKVDEKEGAIRINKIGKGKVRGFVDTIMIVPETSNQFLIR